MRKDRIQETKATVMDERNTEKHGSNQRKRLNGSCKSTERENNDIYAIQSAQMLQKCSVRVLTNLLWVGGTVPPPHRCLCIPRWQWTDPQFPAYCPCPYIS